MSDFTRTDASARPTAVGPLARSARAVESLLSSEDTLEDDSLGGVGRVRDEEGHFLALDRGKVLQDEVCGVHTPGRATDPDPHADVVARTERLRDVTQAVVAALAAAQLEAHLTEGHVELVVHDDD